MSIAEIKHLATTDPLRRQVERGPIDDEMSPMDPPDAYKPPALDRVPVEELHPFLRRFVSEHEHLLAEMDRVAAAVRSVKQSGFTREVHGAIETFLKTFDDEFVSHSRIEETILFGPLAARLLETGEHSKGPEPTTAVDLMLDEHLRANRLAAVVAGCLVMAPMIRDEDARRIVVGTALNETMNLVELLRLHIFREDGIVFASAHRLLSPDELSRMQVTTSLR
ncbi:hemerythrin domain-containing protein [Candidatus Binatia bacterium]|nr:hemerythrin domain-containing protein [Candidatus Binatia bacterium]